MHSATGPISVTPEPIFRGRSYLVLWQGQRQVAALPLNDDNLKGVQEEMVLSHIRTDPTGTQHFEVIGKKGNPNKASNPGAEADRKGAGDIFAPQGLKTCHRVIGNRKCNGELISAGPHSLVCSICGFSYHLDERVLAGEPENVLDLAIGIVARPQVPQPAPPQPSPSDYLVEGSSCRLGGS